jgi:hypothetical protein
MCVDEEIVKSEICDQSLKAIVQLTGKRSANSVTERATIRP